MQKTILYQVIQFLNSNESLSHFIVSMIHFLIQLITRLLLFVNNETCAKVGKNVVEKHYVCALCKYSGPVQIHVVA